jgi:hypothetical protein
LRATRHTQAATTGDSGHDRRGGALVLALIAVIVVSTLAAAALSMNGVVTRRLNASNNKKLAFYMAEAGLAEAYGGLLLGKTGNVGTPQRPAAFGDGLFWVVATQAPDETVELTATGMVGNGSAVLSLVAEPGDSTVVELGMFSAGDVSVQAGAVIDGYDSELGSYASQVLGGLAPLGAGRLGSNGGVTAEGSEAAPTVLNAELSPGPGETLVSTGEVEVYGVVESGCSSVSLPPASPPSGSMGRGITHSSQVPMMVLPGTTHLDFLSVSANAEVRVEGPATLVLGGLRLEPSATLVIDPTDGPIDVYVTRALDLQLGSFLLTEGTDPSLVRLHVAGSPASPARLGSGADFHGVIYAPEAHVVVAEPFQVFGALIADQLELQGAVGLHFDRRLARVSLETTLPKLLSWRIVELKAGLGRHMDPFSARGLDRSTLPSPADAHADQTLHVEYFDRTGTPRTYDGMESGFDWSDVLAVDRLVRDGDTVTGLDVTDTKLAPADLALIALIEGDTAPRDITRDLIDASPLSAAVIEAAMTRKDPLMSDHYRRILLANSPLPPRALEMVVRDDPQLMDAFDRNEVLTAQ